VPGHGADLVGRMRHRGGHEHLPAGHAQRRARPGPPPLAWRRDTRSQADDRVMATRLGAEVVQLILKRQFGKAVGLLEDRINVVDLSQARQRVYPFIDDYCELIEHLR